MPFVGGSGSQRGPLQLQLQLRFHALAGDSASLCLAGALRRPGGLGNRAVGPEWALPGLYPRLSRCLALVVAQWIGGWLWNVVGWSRPAVCEVCTHSQRLCPPPSSVAVLLPWPLCVLTPAVSPKSLPGWRRSSTLGHLPHSLPQPPAQ